MSTSTPHAALALLITVSGLLSGCRKGIDFIRRHPGEAIPLCKIWQLRLADRLNPNFPDTTFSNITVSYNNAGDPVSMITSWDEPFNQQGVDIHFRYDKHGRLTDQQVSYTFAEFGPSLAPVTWDRYSYPGHNTIVDSLYAYGDALLDAPNPAPSSFEGRTLISTLDDKGRIIRTQEYVGGQPGSITNFHYDTRGNLIREGITYDNHIAPRRTSKTWMFIGQDYSVNCPNTGFGNFNAFGLPQDIRDAYIFGYSTQHMKITYGCDCDIHGSKDQ